MKPTGQSFGTHAAQLDSGAASPPQPLGRTESTAVLDSASFDQSQSTRENGLTVAVVICSVNRAAILHDTVCSIQRQSLRPTQIIISTPGQDHVRPETLALPGVSVVLSPLGSAVQRNRGLDAVAPGTDLLAFLDDDFELSESYFHEMSRLFLACPEVVIACGNLLYDGGRGRAPQISRADAREMCEAAIQSPGETPEPAYQPLDWAYGCNMFARRASVAGIRFDENLLMYAWLEDSDYGFRSTVGRCGPVTCMGAKGIHLGWRGGRTAGVRFGFSQIVNPMYLRRKARVFPLRHIVVNYWLRCFLGNILGILRGDQKWDRPGGLKGNLLGFTHLLSGHCDPTEIARL
jgi:glycosyltransferase involved in cell wall biosynthesis